MTSFSPLSLLELLAYDKTEGALSVGTREFKVDAFSGLAFWMLAKFVEHDSLQELQATAIYRTAPYPEEQLVEIGHHLKLTAVGADVGLNDPTSYEKLLTKVAPVRFLGEGSFVLKREDDLVGEFIAALGKDDNDELALSVIHRLASRLVPVIGKLAVVHRLNSFM
ncbi:hypothetical protein D3C71_25770 [compost metagenome]